MTAAQRMKLFEALFPKFADAVEAGWQLLDRMPYQSGYEIKPFRGPGCESLLLSRRLDWVDTVLEYVAPYPNQDLAWHAAWIGHYAPYGNHSDMGTLFAAVMDKGGKQGDEIFEVLRASACGEHETGTMGRHVTSSFLSSARPECWEFIEKMLLAAQREEGLRQNILESVDIAHPAAFRRMLRLIIDNNLVRFSATVRALDVWLGYQWDSESAGIINKVIGKLVSYLDDAAAREAALQGE